MKQGVSQAINPFLHCIQLFLLLAFCFTIMIPIIYQFSVHQPYDGIPHSLNQIFQIQEQKQIVQKLGKKGYRHAILTGNKDSGVFEFVQHYANKRAQKGKTVIMRKYNKELMGYVHDYVRKLKDYLQDRLDLEQNFKRIQWIFILADQKFPQDQIKNIERAYPKDRILIVVDGKPNGFQNFKVINYPQVQTTKIKQIITSQFEIDPIEAQILMSHYNTIPQIFQQLNHINYSHKKYLGLSYYNFEGIKSKQKKFLKKLCSQGKAQLNQSTQNIDKAGVLFYKGVGYWKDQLKILNYELFHHQKCLNQAVSKDILFEKWKQSFQKSYSVENQQKEKKKQSKKQKTKTKNKTRNKNKK